MVDLASSNLAASAREGTRLMIWPSLAATAGTICAISRADLRRLSLATVATIVPTAQARQRYHPGNWKARPMPETPFEIGARVTTADDAPGHVIRIIVNPASDTVTHVVVELGGQKRLVPIDHVHVSADGLRLNCTQADFDKLKPAGIAGWYDAGRGRYGYPIQGKMTYDSIPFGEVEVRRGDQVHATDGEIGLVDGLLVDPADHRATHVLLQEGHLWGHKVVAIPMGAVAEVRVGVRLNLSKQQVENLPPVAVNRPGH